MRVTWGYRYPHMYALSRCALVAVPTARDANGRVTARHAARTKLWAPKLHSYINCRYYEGKGTSEWALCVFPDDTVIPQDALSDPDVILLNYPRGQALSTGSRTDVGTKLAQCDFGGRVAVSDGDEVDDVVQKVARAGLGHSTGFVASSLTHTKDASGSRL
jgi:hypothetical protein